MTEDEFWGHIRASGPDPLDPEAQAERLTARLAKLPPDDILDFVAHWDRAGDRAYLRELWAAAYLINGGCSDDGFQYFRWWLVLQGRAVYEAAVADPDTLAAVVEPETEVYEAEEYPGMDAWFAVTGAGRDDEGYDAYGRALEARRPDRPPLPDLAPRWDFDDDAEVRRRLPRLAALYLAGEDD